MAREVYEQIDECKTAIYTLIDKIRSLGVKDQKLTFTYAYIELFASFDSLADNAGERIERVRNTTADRSSGVFETGYGREGV